MTRALRAASFALLLLLAAGRPAAAATAPVSYLSGGSVYVDAGALEGLRVGDTLRVLRDGREVARVRVTFTSSHRAACDTLWTRAAVAIGDVVSYTAAPVPPRDTTAAGPLAPSPPGGPATAAGPSANRARLRGRIGAGWLSVTTSEGGSFRQPSLALRFDGTNLNAGRNDVTFDMRSRRTTRNFSGSGTSVENIGRVYRAAVTMRAANPGRRLTIGRQASAALASVNLFDGALLEIAGETHAFGVFAGSQPEYVRYGFSSDIIEGGAWFEFHQPPFSAARWSVAVGGVTSLDHGHPNRDFAFAQGGWYSKGLTASLTQEIDVNRSWKRANGEPLLTATTTFAHASAPLAPWFTVNGGFDNRRSVRLYRDRLTPETEFDDAFRQGAWAGGQLAFLSHLRLGGDTRVSSGAGRAQSWTVHAEAWRLTRLNASVRGRFSRYSDGQQVSLLQSYGFGFEPLRAARLGVSGGVRSTRNDLFGVDEREHWVGADTDVTIGRSWYLGAGWERDHGGSSDTKQVQASLNRRF